MFDHVKEGLLILKKVIPYIKNQDRKIKISLLTSLFLFIITIIINISLPLCLKKIIILLDKVENFSYLVIMTILSYGLLWTGSKIIFSIREIILYPVMERMLNVLSYNFLEHISRLPITFHIEQHSGKTISIVDRALIAFPNIFWGLVFSFFPLVIEIIFAVIILFKLYGIKYSLILLLGMLNFLFFNIISTKKAIKLRELSNNADKLVKIRLVENLSHFETIKYFGSYKNELKRYKPLIDNKEKYSTQSMQFLAFLHIIQNIIIGGTLIFLTLLAGYDILHGVFDISDFVLIQSYIFQFFVPLNTFGFLFRNIHKSLADMKSFFAILDKPIPKKVLGKKVTHKEIKSFDIKFKNVFFEYDKSYEVLSNTSFYLPQGKVTALIGRTGIGKSTITKIIGRLYDINSGTVHLGGYNIRSISFDDLSTIVGYVPQEAAIFDESIEYNIRYGNFSASNAELNEAIKNAGLDKFIKTLPDKYNTVVGEKGIRLSGGERQRIALARLFLKKPKVIILDEPTSFLDFQTAKSIQKSIKKLVKDRTVLIVTHKYDIVSIADQVLHLQEDGKVSLISMNDAQKMGILLDNT